MLAQRENEADLVGGVNIGAKDLFLARTLLDLSQTATINDSLKLGKYLLGELGAINTLHKNNVEQAGFAVLKACLLYTSPSPRDRTRSRMPSSA